MSSDAMILMRLVMAFFSLSGGVISSASTPSTRYRTRSFFSYGSMWMSLAPFLMALSRIMLTSLTTGASSLAFSSSRRLMSSSSPAELDLGFVEAGHDLVVRGAGVVILLDRALDRGLARDDGLDVVARQELEVVDGVQVRRVCHGDDERVARARDRNDLVALARLLRDELQDVDVDLVFLEVDRRDAVLLAEKVRDLVVRDVARAWRACSRGCCPTSAAPPARSSAPQAKLRKLVQGDELSRTRELAQAVVVRPCSTRRPSWLRRPARR
jgi:hypothetical protein